MRKTLLTCAWLLLAATGVFADDYDNEESKNRINQLCEIYNADLNDSLIHQAPRDMQFHKEQNCWEHYYETWSLLVNTYIFMGQVNTGLQEVKLMHQDAAERNDPYGLALANYAMGNAYNNMGQLDEAISCYDQSLALIEEADLETTVVNDIFSYYCDVLKEQKRYQEMGVITEKWKKAIDELVERQSKKEGKQLNGGVWNSYYYLACAQMNLGLGNLDEAEKAIDEAEKSNRDKSEFIPMSVTYYRAQLWLQRRNYQKALDYNTQRLEKSRQYDDKSSEVLIYLQRAEIMKGLGEYKEAADMYQSVYELTDSIYKKDARTQINELNTLFRVNEMEMEKRLSRNRSVAVIAIIIALALALLLGYGSWMNLRLRRKNEELAIAHAQAEESLRMKSDFIKNISHEIRTPLNILSGFSQVLAQQDADLPQEVRQEASVNIQQNTNRITSLINRLLALSESSSRSLIERTDTISAEQLCQTAIAGSGVADDKRHQFSFSSTLGEGLTIVTSEKYASQAICHLLDNAMKFTPEGGSISMSCRTEGNVLAISIEDNGNGVPKEKAEEIFDEFVQLDTFKDGVGIGLSLSRNIVRQLGGDLVLDTNYQKGARFVLTLPL